MRFEAGPLDVTLPQYDAATQAKLTDLFVKCCQVHQLLPLSFFEGEGPRALFASILPRAQLPSHQSVARAIAKMDEEHLAKVKDIAATLRSPIGPLCVAEVDCWPAPTDENYFGLILHGLDPDFKPVSLLLYADILGVPETAHNQAQRMIYVARELLGVDIADLCWSVQSDNTGKAANIAGCLKLESLRCVAHILALGPRHLLHPVERTVQGVKRKQAHERAVKSVFDVCEKIRAFVRHMKNHEQEGRRLVDIMKRLEDRVLQLDLDQTSKWDGTLEMLQRITEAERALRTYFLDHGAGLSQHIVLVDVDFALCREVAGVLRPISNVIALLEGDDFKGGAVLPLLWLLEQDLADDAPVTVASARQGEPFAEMPGHHLSSEAREFRRVLLGEVHITLRHLQGSRPTLLLASALDPRWRALPFASESERAETRRRLQTQAVEIVGQQAPAARPSPASAPLKRLRPLPGMERLLERAQRLQGLSPTPQGEAQRPPAEDVSRALDDWFALPALPTDSSPLDFWQEAVRQDAPAPWVRLLAPLARKYLASPGASGSIERVWSQGRRVITFNRHALSGERVCQLLRLKHNLAKVGMWPPSPLAL